MPEFSSKHFIILDLSYRCAIHSLELVFVYGVKLGVQIYILYVDFQLSQTICWKDHFPFIKLSWSPISMNFYILIIYIITLT